MLLEYNLREANDPKKPVREVRLPEQSPIPLPQSTPSGDVANANKKETSSIWGIPNIFKSSKPSETVELLTRQMNNLTKEYESKTQKLQDELQTCKRQRDELDKRLGTANEKVKKLETEKVALENKNNGLQKARDEDSKKSDTLQAGNYILTLALQSANTRSIVLESKLTTLTTQTTSNISKIEDLERKLAQADHTCKEQKSIVGVL